MYQMQISADRSDHKPIQTGGNSGTGERGTDIGLWSVKSSVARHKAPRADFTCTVRHQGVHCLTVRMSHIRRPAMSWLIVAVVLRGSSCLGQLPGIALCGRDVATEKGLCHRKASNSQVTSKCSQTRPFCSTSLLWKHIHISAHLRKVLWETTEAYGFSGLRFRSAVWSVTLAPVSQFQLLHSYFSRRESTEIWCTPRSFLHPFSRFLQCGCLLHHNSLVRVQALQWAWTQSGASDTKHCVLSLERCQVLCHSTNTTM